jgi:hypothetical protein
MAQIGECCFEAQPESLADCRLPSIILHSLRWFRGLQNTDARIPDMRRAAGVGANPARQTPNQYFNIGDPSATGSVFV